jgi:hypothetical protein
MTRISKLDEHQVQAREPAWVQITYTPTEDGDPDPNMVNMNTDGSIDMMEDQAEYRCTCGMPLDSFADVIEHFKQAANGELEGVWISCPECPHDEQLVTHTDDVVIDVTCSACGHSFLAQQKEDQ